FDELLIRAGRRLMKGELKRGPMPYGAVRNRRSELGDLFGDGSRVRRVESLLGDLPDAIQIGVITPDQLDQDGFLGFEMVIQAPRQDPSGVGNLLEGGAQTGGGDQRSSSLEDFGSAGSIAVRIARAIRDPAVGRGSRLGQMLRPHAASMALESHHRSPSQSRSNLGSIPTISQRAAMAAQMSSDFRADRVVVRTRSTSM